MEKIFLYDMDRVLLIFLLLADLENDDITYVTYEGKEKILEGLPGRKVILKNSDMYASSPIFNRFKMASCIKKVRKELDPLLKRVEKGEARIYGMDNLELGRRVFYKDRISVIEEGTLNYMPFKGEANSMKKILQNLISSLYGLGERKNIMGYGEKVDRVYLTTSLCEKIPVGLENKAKIIDLETLWRKKSQKQKTMIMQTFRFNSEILEKVDKDTVMLFTQPMSEDGIITEEEKLAIYSKVLAKYADKSVIIKAHPREKTEYSKYFPNCYVMKERYPIELLGVMGIKIERVVTLFSTAVFGFGKDVAIDFYGTEIDEKLFKRFGSCDNIMKRNCFI